MRVLVPTILALGLVGCGDSPESAAVAACKAAIVEKLADKTFTLDEAEMLAKASTNADGVVQINSTIVFDKGLPSEYTQGVDCKARNNPSTGGADVISLGFAW